MFEYQEDIEWIRSCNQFYVDKDYRILFFREQFLYFSVSWFSALRPSNEDTDQFLKIPMFKTSNRADRTSSEEINDNATK